MVKEKRESVREVTKRKEPQSCFKAAGCVGNLITNHLFIFTQMKKGLSKPKPFGRT